MTAALDIYPVRRTSQLGRPVSARVAVWLREEIRRRYRIWRDRRHLHELPDYLLEDIGIGRSEIELATAQGLGDASRGQWENRSAGSRRRRA